MTTPFNPTELARKHAPWRKYGIARDVWRKMGYSHRIVRDLRRESRRPVSIGCVLVPASPFTK
jgi:hypothetical protein